MSVAPVREASRLAWRGLGEIARRSCTDHPVHARLLHHLGVALSMIGDVAVAWDLLAQSLSERRRLLGYVHPEKIEGMASLAALHLLQGNTSGAFELYREAMALAEQALGEDHGLVADCAVGLAFAFRRLGAAQGKAAALELLQRSRQIRRKVWRAIG